jgi:3-hydroxyisobutyrate dehydrogenase-like beta-hydroxyacid dehydrogenase
MRIGVVHPGEMGSAIGALLVEQGHEVLWVAEGRSEDTAGRARAAGMRAVELEELRTAEMIMSVCPPHAALEVARLLSGTDALVIDANAVSPAIAQLIGETLGGRWVDGAIVGPPPSREGTTRVFVSGRHGAEAASLFADTRLEPVVLDGAATAASALKMAYAAWTKGSAALLLAAFALARANAVDEDLRNEWRRSQPQLEQRLQGAVASASVKGWRWTGEMQEIAASFAQAGLPSGFADAAAEVFAAAPRGSGLDLEELLAALLGHQPPGTVA